MKTTNLSKDPNFTSKYNKNKQRLHHTNPKTTNFKNRTHFVWEPRVEAMTNLGDLMLAIGGKEKDGYFWDWKLIAFNFNAIFASAFCRAFAFFVTDGLFPPQKLKLRKRVLFCELRESCGTEKPVGVWTLEAVSYILWQCIANTFL